MIQESGTGIFCPLLQVILQTPKNLVPSKTNSWNMRCSALLLQMKKVHLLSHPFSLGSMWFSGVSTNFFSGKQPKIIISMDFGVPGVCSRDPFGIFFLHQNLLCWKPRGESFFGNSPPVICGRCPFLKGPLCFVDPPQRKENPQSTILNQTSVTKDIIYLRSRGSLWFTFHDRILNH